MTLEGWNYRKSHTITHPTGGLTNYQTKIRVYRTTGTDSGDAVYVGDKCRADFGDVRFTNSAGSELDYWMETNAGSYADFWVKLDSITTSATFYIYYGNSSATSMSNGDTTFPFFDDFSGTLSTLWNTSGTVLNSGGICTITNAGYIQSKTSYGANYSFRFSARFQGVNQNWAGWMSSTSGGAPYHIFQYKSGSVTSTVASGSDTDVITSFTGAYHTFEIAKSSSNAKFYLDNVLQTTSTELVSSSPVLFHTYSGTQTFLIDFVLIRQYANTEPVHSTWGTEQDLLATDLTIRITPTSGTDPLSVTYNCIIPEGTLNNFVLNYGDGNEYTSATQSTFATTHTYDTPGTYTVWGEGYTEFATHVYYELPYGVTVNAEAVVASFSVDQTYNTVTFTNTSTGNINECYWDFGDDNHSYEQNPVHTYWSPATYTVTLYTSNQYQYDTYTTTVTVTQVLTPPEVYFTPNNLNVISPTLPYTVNFTNLSTPAFGCTYNWLIDGVSYTTQNTSHSFATYGMYDVGLTVTNALGSATKTYNDAIRITRKGKTFYEVINYADTPATFHVEVFNEVATSADTIIQAHIFDESINFVQDEIPDEPGLDEWGMRHFYSSINEWGHRIISAVTDWGNRILYNGSTLDNSPVTLFKAQEFREDVVFIDEWQFGTT